MQAGENEGAKCMAECDASTIVKLSKEFTPDALAWITGLSRGLVSQLLHGKARITPQIAVRLSAVLGDTPRDWLTRQMEADLAKLRPDAELSARVRLAEIAPVAAMLRRKWIGPAASSTDIEHALCTFFETTTLSPPPSFSPPPIAQCGQELGRAEIAWLFRARRRARQLPPTGTYTPANCAAAAAKLRAVLPASAATQLATVPDILQEAGIRFLIVEPLAPAPLIDGASFWGQNGPVIVLTLRDDQIGGFWRLLLHELGHVQDEQGLRQHTRIDIALRTSDTLGSPAERAADAYAESVLLSEAQQAPLQRTTTSTLNTIRSTARQHHISPGVLASYLQGRQALSANQARAFQRPVCRMFPNHTDGWRRRFRGITRAAH